METWEKWEPTKGIPEKLYSGNLLENKDGLVITFKNESFTKKCTFIFHKAVLSFRSTDRKRCQIQDRDQLNTYALYKVRNSEYIQWYSGNNVQSNEKESISHYVFYALDIVIEVLSLSEPEVSLQEIIPSDGTKKVGLLEDGRLVIARSICKQGYPTLETQEKINTVKFIRFIYKE